MVRLLANPGEFDGKRVLVRGFLNLEFEGDALYLHKEDFDNCLSENAIWVDVSPVVEEKRTELNGRYVLLEGEFCSQRQGHFGLFAASICKMTRAEPSPTRQEYEEIRNQSIDVNLKELRLGRYGDL
jgi:hypothetical protein